MQFPTIDQLGADAEALKQEAATLPADHDAILEHLAKLRTLAVYLNAHLTSPVLHAE